MTNPLDCFLKTDRDRAVFGEHWCGPEKYVQGKKEIVATYKAEGDGTDVTVSCTACPATFYEIEFKDFKMTTGSGRPEMAHAIAKAISEGMLDVYHMR
jgi:hypothetical protein